MDARADDVWLVCWCVCWNRIELPTRHYMHTYIVHRHTPSFYSINDRPTDQVCHVLPGRHSEPCLLINAPAQVQRRLLIPNCMNDNVRSFWPLKYPLTIIW